MRADERPVNREDGPPGSKFSTIPLRELRALAVPAAVIVLAALSLALGRFFPESLLAVGLLGPYVVLLLGAAISFWFNRGRAFIALVSLLAAYAGYHAALASGPDSFTARAVFVAVAVFVPLNCLIALLLPERGIFHYRNYRWLLLGAIELLLTAWIASAGRIRLSGTAWQDLLDTWLLRAEPMPFLGRLLMAAAFAFAVARAWRRRSPIDIGMAGALVALFIACQWPSTPGVFGTFIAAAAAILLLAVLQESHRMAFRDELTGLPSRRALEERLLALGPVYTIAMVDVDHFKKFNDTHGHDVGDQVLRLVGAHLAELPDGARAYRYGGEEFSVLLETPLREAMPRLEALREAIERYRMTVRTQQRRKEPRSGTERRAPSVKKRTATSSGDVVQSPLRHQELSVTVSIGVSERSENRPTPAEVIRAADEALYRAKEKGRNRVSL
jgi:diguanylate cyclase (GGDEF)-like protein